ncbi:unnamed protein product [Sphagnum troendelagicum]|uniref:Uncharacterized protein n=1 Tax=Sphagnum troendelagicum TaxID=128251 RepID=A0ABP0UGD2_9BRYO
MAAAASSLISTSLEASIFSIQASSKLLRHIHEHQTGIHRIPALSSQKSSGCGGVSCRGRRGGISRRRRRRRSLLVLCLSSISSSGDGGRSCSNSHDGDLEDLHSSEHNSNSSSDDNPQASRSEHPFLPSQKQQNQRDGETTTARVLEASAAAQSALERAAAYRKTQASVVVPIDESSSDSLTSRSSEAPTKVPEKELEVDDKNKKNNNKAAVVALSAFERAQAYRKQQAEMVAALGGGKEEKNKKKNKSAAKLNSLEEEAAAAAAAAVPNKGEEEEDEGEADEKNKMVEIEIYTRDGIVRRKVSKPETAFSNIRDIKRKGMSDMDFAGLGFADKKSSGTPAGLSQGFTVPTGALPEVEILTRDGAQGKQPQTTTASEETDLYKPRVSTWGVFPRPADISKTYGGGRTIRPGESLETPQEKEAREARTKKLLDDYRHKMGLDIDPELKMQCEKILKQGESLMDRGLLREALVSFESVMEKISFQSEVHGLAALRGAVCMDSLNRSREAKLVYEKLVSHPNQTVRKKAGQLLFGFQAAETLKVTGGYKWDTSTYRKYFDSFADGYNTMYKASKEEEEDQGSSDLLLKQSLPYAIFLIFPVLVVFTLAALKNS